MNSGIRMDILYLLNHLETRLRGIRLTKEEAEEFRLLYLTVIMPATRHLRRAKRKTKDTNQNQRYIIDVGIEEKGKTEIKLANPENRVDDIMSNGGTQHGYLPEEE